MTNLFRMCLVWILVFLPFQRKLILLSSNAEIALLFQYMDEIIILIFFPLAIVKLYKTNNNPAVSFSILFFVMSGVISGFINGNAFITTAAGIFDYMKNFLVIIIYFSFFKDISDFKKIFRFLLIVAVILGIVSFIQELWATGSLYIFKKDIANHNNYIFQKDININLLKNYWRFGIFRTSSLMVSTINSGLYGLLILTIYLGITKKVNFAVVAALFSSIFTSISRIVYAGFILVAGEQIVRARRWLIILLLPVIPFMFYMSTFWDLNVLESLNKETVTQVEEIETGRGENGLIDMKTDEEVLSVLAESSKQHYREYARGVGLEIWKDHPLWGVGPGMFGGVVSSLFNSHVYIEYNFTQTNYFAILKSIDNFWIQVLAEVGIIGALAVAGVFISIILLLHIQKKQATSEELKGICRGLIIYSMVIILYTLGLGLNITAVLFTYCALIGIALSCDEREDSQSC